MEPPGGNPPWPEQTHGARHASGKSVARVTAHDYAGPPPRGTARQRLMAVVQSAMHDWLDHPLR